MGEFAETWLRIFGRYWVHILALFADLTAIITIVLAFVTDHGRNLVTFYVLAMVTVLWILLIVQEYRYARKASYSEVTRYFHAAIHFLRDTIDEVPSMSNRDLARSLQRTLSDIATAFALATRTGCRASIKVLTLASDAPKDRPLNRREIIRFLLVRTFARDTLNEEGQVQETPDYVTENTDFLELFNNPKEVCFFENDSRTQYRNSHLPGGYDNRRDDWPLPYRSTIVWPIRRVKQTTDGDTQPDLLGFLCVDSGARNVFLRRYDHDLGAAFADALYMYMAQQPASFALGG
jgi:hypothetical protein